MEKIKMILLFVGILLTGCTYHNGIKTDSCDNIPEPEYFYFSNDSSGWMQIVAPIDSCGYFRLYLIEYPSTLMVDDWGKWMNWADHIMDSLYMQFL